MAVETHPKEQRKLLTADDLLAMPEGDTKRELVRGELIEMSPSGGPHGILSFDIAFLISSRSDARERGVITVEGAGYILFRNPDTVRAPDVGYLSNERYGDTTKEGYFQVAPDLAVEIMSPNDSGEEILEKIGEYLEAGTKLVVVLYPKLRNIMTHTNERVQKLGLDDTLDLSPIIPGLTLPVRDIFAPLDK